MKKAGIFAFIIGFCCISFYAYKMENYSQLSKRVSWDVEKADIYFGVPVRKVSPSVDDFSFVMPAFSSRWGKIETGAISKVFISEEERLRNKMNTVQTPANSNSEKGRKLVISSVKYVTEQKELIEKSGKTFIVGNREVNPLFYRASYFSFPAPLPNNSFQAIEALGKITKKSKANWEKLEGSPLFLGGNTLVLKTEHTFELRIRKTTKKVTEKSLVFIRNGKEHVISLLFPAELEEGKKLFKQMLAGISWDDKQKNTPDLLSLHNAELKRTLNALIISSVVLLFGIGVMFLGDKES